MKSMQPDPATPSRQVQLLGLLAFAFLLTTAVAGAADPKPAPSNKLPEAPDSPVTPADPTGNVTVESIERPDALSSARQESWLGVGTEEAPEVVVAQLRLSPGVGLVVNYVAPDSPAAKVGLKKNDLIIECDGQSLLLPAQLRKAIRVRNPGDSVKLSYYRDGRKESVTATLAARPADLARMDQLGPEPHAWRDLQRQLQDLPVREALGEQLKAMRKSLKDVQIDRKKLQDEVLRSVEDAQRAVRDALHSAPDLKAGLEPMRRRLEELAHSHVHNDSSVTVRSTSSDTKSIVQTDDSGTLVIICNPKPHLTAHDANGKLLFDGEISTSEQQQNVPKDVWTKAEPLLKKIKARHAPAVEEEEEEKEDR